MRFVIQVTGQLAGAPAEVYAALAERTPKAVAELLAGVDGYLGSLLQGSPEAEFQDLDTARRVATLCRTLVLRLQAEPDPDRHRAVQAAVDYFLLEHDGEPDGSIIGFDDDLEVVRATARALGWELPEEGA